EQLRGDHLADVLDRIVDSNVDCEHREPVAVDAKRRLQVRHLLAARHAPRRPELEIDWTLPEQRREIDMRAVEQLERHRRRSTTNQPIARCLHETRSFTFAAPCTPARLP